MQNSPDEQTTEQTGSHTELQCSLRWIDHSGGRGENKESVFLRSRSANTHENLNQVFPSPLPPNFNVGVCTSGGKTKKKKYVDSTLNLGGRDEGSKVKTQFKFSGWRLGLEVVGISTSAKADLAYAREK